MTDIIVTTAADGGPGSLRDAIIQANASLDPSSTITFDPTLVHDTSILLASALPAIAANVTIDGSTSDIDGNVSSLNITIDGGSAARVFFVSSGDVSFRFLTIANGSANGGDGGTAGGGGGMGAGAAIFVNSGNTTVSNVDFTNNHATGGAGGPSANDSAGGGGGGLGTTGGDANGGDALTPDGGAGGGVLGPGPSGAGGTATTPDGGSGVDFRGGGGGAAVVGGNGGAGGFAGGGGAGGYNATANGGAGGAGGFGGGGGGGGGAGAVGGIGGSGGTGGVGGGSGAVGGDSGGPADGDTGAGGGGAALGGAVFVRSGASLTLAGGTFTGSGVTGGTGAATGAAVGSDLFLMTGTTTTFDPDAGKTLTFNGTIADDSPGSLPTGQSYTAGTGAGASIFMSGAGTVLYTTGHTYSYSGTTTVANGILQVDGTVNHSAITVNGVGTLDGNGTVGAVSVLEGGALAPGVGGIGTLTATSNVVFNLGTLAIDLVSATHDLLNVTGTVNLGSAQLTGSFAGTFAASTAYTIIHTTGGVSGTFDGVNEGAAVNIGGHAFTVSYAANSGTDVVLTAVANGAPSLTGLGPSVTFLENDVNAAPQIIDSNVTFSDVEGNFDGGTLTITGILAEDVVSINQTGFDPGQFFISGNRVLFEGTDIGGISGGSGNNLTITFNGSATTRAIDALIENLTYADASDDPTASRTFTVTVTDNAGGSTGGIALTLNVTPQNEPPAINNVAASASYTENTAPVTLSPGIFVSDPDPFPHGAPGGNGLLLGATIKIATGSVEGDELLVFDTSLGTASTSGDYVGINVHYDYDNTTHILTLSGQDTLIDYAHVLDNIQFRSTSDNPTNFGANPTRTIAWQIQDAGGTANGGNDLSAVQTSTVNVTPINDAPVLSNVAPTAAYAPGSAGATLSPTLAATDVDSLNLVGATVRIAAGLLAGDQLAVNLATDGSGHFQLTDEFGTVTTTNISVASNAGGVLTLQGVDTPSDYQAVLDAVRYSSSQADPTNAGANPTRTIEWQVNDGTALSTVTPEQTTTILHFNFAPVLDLDQSAAGNNFATSFTENGLAVAIADTDVTISDPDTSEMSSATIVLTNAQAGDVLSLGTLPAGISGSVDTSTPGQIVVGLGGAASRAAYQTALQQVFFSSTSENPSTTLRDIAITISDGETQSNIAHTTVTVIAVNDAPVVNANGGGLAYTENQAASAIDPALTLSDVDSATLTGATVSISANFQAGQDVLGFTNQNGISGNYVPTTGVLTLSGTASVANYQAALRSVSYFNSSDAPNGATRTISYQADDGQAQNHASNIATATVTVTPVNDAPVAANGSASGNEDTVISSTVSASDVDTATLSFSLVGANGGAAHGTVALNANGSFTYTPAADFNGSDSFGFKANDGSLDSNVATESLTIIAVNDAPVITSNGGGDTASVSVAENTTAVTTVHATDVDSPTLAYSIAGGADQARFQINAASGALSFVTAPNFAAPSDADHNNSYIVQVRASDGSLADTQTLTVTVVPKVLNIDGGFHGDLGGDHRSDVLIRDAAGTVALWQMNGGQIQSQQNLGAVGNEWHIESSADFGGDGKADVLWRADDGTVALWQMNGAQIQSNQNLGVVGNEWHINGTGDFNNDGKADILWRADNGTVALWQMDGAHIQSNQTVGPVGAEWHVVGIGDFNGDHDSDILWRADDGRIALWQMNGAQIAANVNVGKVTTEGHVVGVGDFNGDGQADILFRADSGTVTTWQMNNSHLQSSQAIGTVGAEWHVYGTADLDGDGKADILWRNDDGTVTAWQMNGTQIAAQPTISPLAIDSTLGVHHYDFV